MDIEGRTPSLSAKRPILRNRRGAGPVVQVHRPAKSVSWGSMAERHFASDSESAAARLDRERAENAAAASWRASPTNSSDDESALSSAGTWSPNPAHALRPGSDGGSPMASAAQHRTMAFAEEDVAPRPGDRQAFASWPAHNLGEAATLPPSPQNLTHNKFKGLLSPRNAAPRPAAYSLQPSPTQHHASEPPHQPPRAQSKGAAARSSDQIHSCSAGQLSPRVPPGGQQQPYAAAWSDGFTQQQYHHQHQHQHQQPVPAQRAPHRPAGSPPPQISGYRQQQPPQSPPSLPPRQSSLNREVTQQQQYQQPAPSPRVRSINNQQQAALLNKFYSAMPSQDAHHNAYHGHIQQGAPPRAPARRTQPAGAPVAREYGSFAHSDFERNYMFVNPQLIPGC